MPLKLYKRKDRPSWSLRGTVGGQRIEESTGTTDRKIAEEIRIIRERELQRARVFGPTATVTWAEAVNIYLDTGKKGRFLEPLSRHFGTTLLADINHAAVLRAAKVLYPGAAPATINRQVITPVTAVMSIAAKNGLCPKPQFERPKSGPRSRRVAATADWLADFVSHADARLGALATFMAFTGVRISNVVDLEWKDVNLQEGYASIEMTKNGEPHQVALADTVVSALANLPDREGRIFGWQHRWSVYKPWQACCKAAGIAYIPPHQAGRHTFASWLLADGHSLKVVADAGGWKSIQLVAQTYGHLERDHIDNAVRNLGRHRDTAKARTKKSTA